MCCQFQLTTDSMSKLVYCARHAGIGTVLKMFHEIQRIAQNYDKVHPIGGIEKTKFVQIWEEMEKIGGACKLG